MKCITGLGDYCWFIQSGPGLLFSFITWIAVCTSFSLMSVLYSSCVSSSPCFVVYCCISCIISLTSFLKVPLLLLFGKKQKPIDTPRNQTFQCSTFMQVIPKKIISTVDLSMLEGKPNNNARSL